MLENSTNSLEEDRVSPQMICGHYDYPDHEALKTRYHAFWPREAVFDRIDQLSLVLRLIGGSEKRFRVVIDYDPEYPRALLQIFGLQEPTLFPGMDNSEDQQ